MRFSTALEVTCPINMYKGAVAYTGESDHPGLDFIFMDSINVHCGIFSMLFAEIYLKAGNGHS